MKKLFLIIIINLTFINYLMPLEFQSKEFGYAVDIPEDWVIIGENKSELISFTDPAQTVYFQIFVFKGESFNNSNDMLNHFKTNLKADGDAEKFLFNNKDSIFSDLTFNIDNINVRGYCVFINDIKYDYLLMTYSIIKNYEVNHDLLISCLDSFVISDNEKYHPGPVSQYYYQFPGKYQNKINININNIQFNSFIDLNDIEITQILIEREARILSGTTESKKIDSWKRFYRMIYKDNYKRLNMLCEDLKKNLNINKSSPDNIVYLVNWIQKFKFTRSGTFADFDSPVSLLSNNSGDCDSRVLLLMIILNQLGIDSILLVSEKYSHSLIAIDINKSGSKYNYNSKDYLMIELTKQAELGVIDKDISDLKYWIPIALNKN